MNKQRVIKLKDFVYEIGKRFSRKDREGNVNGEDFNVKSFHPLGEESAIATYRKSSEKNAIAYMYWENNKFDYFFPTDDHSFGFMFFIHIALSGGVGISRVSQVLDENSLNDDINKVTKEFPHLSVKNKVLMTGDSVAVNFVDANGATYLGYFYYIHRGMSKGWRHFFPTPSHMLGMEAFRTHKVLVEKENTDKNFLEKAAAAC